MTINHMRDLFEAPVAARQRVRYEQPLIIWYRDKRGKLWSPMLDALDFDSPPCLTLPRAAVRCGRSEKRHASRQA